MKHNFEKFCKEPEKIEKIENYEKAAADNFKGWCVHHRLETHNSEGERRLIDITVAELQALDMYYNRPAEELIFLTSSEHSILHNKGESHPMYGKHLSEEHKKKIGEASRNMSEETRNKLSAVTKGTRWFNNGKISKRAFECPEGFTPGRLR